MKANQRVQASVPRDEQRDKDERSCEERYPEGGLVEHVERRAASLAIAIVHYVKEASPGPESQPDAILIHYVLISGFLTDVAVSRFLVLSRSPVETII